MTAVVPTTGRAELLQAVRSVLEQSTTTRVVVVEADPDRHHEVDAQLGCLGGDVTLISPGRHLTASAARNLGTDAVRTPFVAYLDDDDWWKPEKVGAQLSAISATGRKAVVCTTGSFFGRHDGTIGNVDAMRGSRIVPVVPYTSGRIADYVLERPRLRYGHHFMQTSSLLMNTDLSRAARWDEDLVKHEDWDLVIRLTDRLGARFVHVPETMTFVRKGSPGSASQRLTPYASLRWVDGIQCSPHARNDFILSVVVRPALAARDMAAVRAGFRAMKWTSGMSPAAIAGLAGGFIKRTPQES